MTPFVQEHTETLRLKEHPYTYARVSVMKSKLIRKEGYHRLLKMKLAEIAKFLQDLDYKKEINELAMKYSGVALLDFSLNRNLVRDFTKLKRIADDSTLVLLMTNYFQRMDIYNIKTILRALASGADKESVKDLLVPIGVLSEKELHSLLGMAHVEDVLKNIPFIGYAELRDAYTLFRETGSLFELENSLSRTYYRKTIAFAAQLPVHGTFFRNFLEEEIDIMNLKIILRLKREGLAGKDIRRHLFTSGARIHSSMLNRLADAVDVGHVLSSVEKLGYGITKEDVEMYSREKSLVSVDTALSRYLLRRSAFLYHTNPLSVDVILGYMFAKEIEISNLKKIIKGKQLDISEEDVEKELVIVR